MLIRRLITKKIFYKVWRRLHFITLRGLGVLNYENSSISGESHFLKRILKGKMLVFDVGANVGKYSSKVKMFNNESIVYAFEPHPKTFEILKKNVEPLDQVHCRHVALSDHEGESEIFDYKTEDGSSHASLFKGVITDIHKRACVSHKITLTTIDKVVQDLNIKHIDLLKIDVEGNEINVLKGAAQLLKDEKVGVIQFEFNEMNIITKTRFLDFMELLPGYDFFRMFPDGLVKLDYDPVSCEIYAFQNIVAARKDLKFKG